jgi:hypothetical protein
VAATALLAWVLDYLVWALAGFPYDCNSRDDCSALGGFVWGASWPVFITCLLGAAGISLVARRAFVRRRVSKQDAHADF